MIESQSILPLLEQLNEVLRREDSFASLYIGGSAAMVLQGFYSQPIASIEALSFTEPENLDEAISEVGSKNNLQKDWFVYLVGEPIETGPVLLGSNLFAFLSSPEFLAVSESMRIRPNQMHLLRNLFNHVGIERIEDLDRLVYYFYGDKPVIQDFKRDYINEVLVKWNVENYSSN